jgi:MFS family permease
MHNKWFHTWALGVLTIILIAPLVGLIGGLITGSWGWFWLLFGFYEVMGVVCIIFDVINHHRTHRGLFTHSHGCYSLKFGKKEDKKNSRSELE